MRGEARAESPRTHPRESSLLSLMSGWAQQGIQSYFAAQRILVDVAMRQNSSMMDGLKDRLSDLRHAPAAVLTEVAGEGVSNFVDGQKVLLDLVQRQNEILWTGVKERVGGSTAAVALTDLLSQSVDTVIGMQQDFLKIAGKQAHTWKEAAKTGKTLKGSPLIDVAREAVEKFIGAEKRFLDAIAEQTAKATGTKPAGGNAKIKRTELVELGRQATESFIEAQKKLADVAGRQVNASLKMMDRTMDLMKPFPGLPFSEWTERGVKSFVDTQKALIDAVTKPGQASKPSVKAGRTAPVRGARIKVH
jgi:hypothetical protein